MEAASITITLGKHERMVEVQSKKKKYEFDVKVEGKFLRISACFHIIYIFWALLFVSALTLGVYFLS